MLKHLEKLTKNDLKKNIVKLLTFLIMNITNDLKIDGLKFNFRPKKKKKKLDNVILKVRKSCGITILRKKINEKDDKNAECQSPVNLKSSFVKSYSTHA